MAVLPVLEVNHLLKIHTLNLSGNSIDDDALIELCDCLLNIHNTTLQRLDIEETQIGDRGITALIDTMKRITSIWQVGVQSLRLSQPVREKLSAACNKNRIFVEDQIKLGKMYDAA